MVSHGKQNTDPEKNQNNSIKRPKMLMFLKCWQLEGRFCLVRFEGIPSDVCSFNETLLRKVMKQLVGFQ
jgi:hypothetical protein